MLIAHIWWVSICELICVYMVVIAIKVLIAAFATYALSETVTA